MKPMLLLAILFCSFIQTLDRTITGMVTDKNNNPISGVSVYYQDGLKPVFTDAKGRFKISVPHKSKTLKFSLTGYADVVAPITSPHTMKITMYTDREYLDEVIIITCGCSETINS